MLAKTLYRQVFMRVGTSRKSKADLVKGLASVLVGLLATVGVVLADSGESDPAPITSPPVKARAQRSVRAPLLFRHDAGITSRLGGTPVDGARLVEPADAGTPGFRGATARSSLPFLDTYRKALERESKRRLDRNPSLLLADVLGEEMLSERRVSREAERIFDRAHERILSKMLEGLIEGTAPLKAARSYMDGVRLDIKRGGGVDVGSTLRESRRSNIKASFGLIVAGKPRIEMETKLAGAIKTVVEIPITSPGFRTIMSRRLTKNLRGKMKLGMEDDDHWLSLGLEYKF